MGGQPEPAGAEVGRARHGTHEMNPAGGQAATGLPGREHEDGATGLPGGAR